MSTIGIFPFGETVKQVIQTDRTPKKVFVLGVYASAVHARWMNGNGTTRVKALAVASEPYIFWKGEDQDVKQVVDRILLPEGIGYLLPADQSFNGPSGVSLDKHFLTPLGLTRSQTWLCDLVPHSCMNAAQCKAIVRSYIPFIKSYDLPIPTVPEKPKQLTDEGRRGAILNEIKESNAEILILLGDEPIKWFLKHLNSKWKKLSDFGKSDNTYGRLHFVSLLGKQIEILPLVHPRQSASLGKSDPEWKKLHYNWITSTAPTLIL